jgi:hypothetical protein
MLYSLIRVLGFFKDRFEDLKTFGEIILKEELSLISDESLDIYIILRITRDYKEVYRINTIKE